VTRTIWTQLALIVLPSCAEDHLPEAPDAAAGDAGGGPGDWDGPADAAADEDGGQGAGAWRVSVSPDAPPAVRVAADDVAAYLMRMGEQATSAETLEAPVCRAGARDVVLPGDGLDGTWLDGWVAASEQSWRIVETRCGTGRLVRLAGGGLLGRQYAAYEWLHALGVRFFHPEQEYVPTTPRHPEAALYREHTPAFVWRSVSLHLTHPLELGDAFRLGNEAHLDEALRYIDWQVKNGASFGHAGIGSGEYAEYGVHRGFPRAAGFSLHGQQQGGDALIDPDDPRGDEEQIRAAIEERMGADPGRPPELFSFSFNPTEFTEVSDEDAVRQMTFIANYMAERYPDTILMTTNHGSAGEPTPHYGVRYYDLPQFAPGNLGVKVHTLMFYDLFRPAPVYGNEDFHFLREFMDREFRERRLWYFPEAAWWLTFDIPVPLYLPITIEARDRDIQGIAYMLAGKLDGHRVFGSGHEWGYWQNEYCPFRMAADLDYRWRDCLADIASPMGAAAAEVVAVLEDVVRLQERDIVLGDLLPYLVGTDEETEAAAAVGIVFHELPPSPAQVRGWDEAQLTAWVDGPALGLARMDDDYATLVARLAAVRDDVPEDGRPWFDEVLDGVEVTGLRARHAHRVYGALVVQRLGELRDDETLRTQAPDLLAAGLEATEAALRVIRRRERGYRYRPLERSIAGGPLGTDDDNWTVYRYRYLNRTHHAFYWTRIDDLVARALAGPDELVRIADALVGPGERLVVELMAGALGEPHIDFGDGSAGEGERVDHTYGEPGRYTVRVTATRDGQPFEHEAVVASLGTELRTGFSGRLLEPKGAELIQTLMPALTLGPAEGSTLALGFGLDASGDVRPGRWLALEGSFEGEVRTAEASVTVPVVNQGTGAPLGELQVDALVVVIPDDRATVRLEGSLSTQAVVETIVSVGGFEPDGARAMVAQLLGFTPETLPERVPLVVAYEVVPGE